ncbi:PadR family transcriptional regulator [Lactovum odontotermitis]
MATIDLIVLGMLKKESLSAYDIQKLVEYRKVSEWVKISTPSIYKKVIQLEGKGLIKSRVTKEGKMPDKAVYSLTKTGEKEFERLMIEITNKPVNIFLDFNAVIVNLPELPKSKQKKCIAGIEQNIRAMKASVQENLQIKKENPEISAIAVTVLHQQLALAQALEKWIAELKKDIAK